MKKILMLVVLLFAQAGFGAEYTGVSNSDKELLAYQDVIVTQIEYGEKYELQLSYQSEETITTICSKYTVNHGLPVFKCMLDEENNISMDLVFWQKMGIIDMMTLAVNNTIMINLEKKE